MQLAARGAALIENLNEKVGGDQNDFFRLGSWIYADDQVTYKVFLVQGARRVDTAGIPTWFTFSYNPGSDTPGVIEEGGVLEQSGPEVTGLSDLSNPGSQVTQYDIISIFQNAAIFRTLFLANKEAFRTFLSAACAISR